MDQEEGKEPKIKRIREKLELTRRIIRKKQLVFVPKTATKSQWKETIKRIAGEWEETEEEEEEERKQGERKKRKTENNEKQEQEEPANKKQKEKRKREKEEKEKEKKGKNKNIMAKLLVKITDDQDNVTEDEGKQIVTLALAAETMRCLETHRRNPYGLYALINYYREPQDPTDLIHKILPNSPISLQTGYNRPPPQNSAK